MQKFKLFLSAKYYNYVKLETVNKIKTTIFFQDPLSRKAYKRIQTSMRKEEFHRFFLVYFLIYNSFAFTWKVKHFCLIHL